MTRQVRQTLAHVPFPGLAAGHVTRSSRPAGPVPQPRVHPGGDGDGTVDQAAKQYFTKDRRARSRRSSGSTLRRSDATRAVPVGLGVELEHGPRDPETDVSADDPIVTGKIALAQPHGVPRLLHASRRLGTRSADHLSKKSRAGFVRRDAHPPPESGRSHHRSRRMTNLHDFVAPGSTLGFATGAGPRAPRTGDHAMTEHTTSSARPSPKAARRRTRRSRRTM